MKIDRVTNLPTRGTRPGARGRVNGSGNFSKALASGEGSPAGAVSGATAPSGVDALLALQEVGARPDSDSHGRHRGEALLDRLDDLRLALLEGRLSKPAIESLAGLAGAKRDRVRDPKLAEILDEIELRAAVELAKLGR